MNDVPPSDSLPPPRFPVVRGLLVAAVLGACAFWALYRLHSRSAPERIGPPPAEASRRTPDVVPQTAEADPHRRPPASLLKLSPDTLELGELCSYEVKTVIFSMTNMGAMPMIVEKLPGSCNCLYYQLLPTPLKPGERREVKLQVTGIVTTLPKDLQVRIRTDEPKAPIVGLPVHMTLKTDFVLDPGTLVFDHLPQPGEYTKPVFLKRLSGKPWSIKAVVCIEPDWKFAWERTEQNTCRIDVTVRAVSPGATTTGAVIQTDDPSVPNVPLAISVELEHDVVASEPLLKIVAHGMEPADPVETVLTRRSPGKLEIENVTEIGNRTVTYSVKHLTEGSCRVTMSVQGPLKHGRHGTLLVQTNVAPECVHLPYEVVWPGEKSSH